VHAARTHDPKILTHTMDGIIRSDRNFPILGTGWIRWTLILFTISGVAFVARVAPLQRQLRALAEAGAKSGAFDYTGYHRLARRWEFWGAIALLTPLAGLLLMVLKPAL
jgi:uncharacterized membrane protein